MTPVELIRAEIARIEEKHVQYELSPGRVVCEQDSALYPCETIRLAGALKGAIDALEKIAAHKSGGLIQPDTPGADRFNMLHGAREALSRISALLERSNG